MDAGETAVLICVGFGQPRADITWTRDGQEISNTSLVTIYEEDLAQGGRVFKQSFLQLCSLRMSDSGVYTCSVSNGLSSVNSSVELAVSGRLLLFKIFCCSQFRPYSDLHAFVKDLVLLKVGEKSVLSC